MEDLRSHAIRAQGNRASQQAPQQAPDNGADRREFGSPSEAYREQALADAMTGEVIPTDSDDPADLYESIYRQRYAERYSKFAEPRNVVPYEIAPPRQGTLSSSYRTDYFPREGFSRGDRNFALGPVDVNLGASAYLEYDDNILRSSTDQLSDFKFGTFLDVSSAWQATENSQIDLQVGIGIERYLDHQDVASASGNDWDVYITPNSLLSFDIFAGEVLINFHDRLAIQSRNRDLDELDAFENFGRVENEAGVAIYWPVNSAVDLSVGYDFFTSRALQNDFEFTDRNAHEAFISSSYSPNDTWRVGAEGSAAFISYLENFNNDSDTFNLGGYFETPISRHTQLRFGTGYQWIDSSDTGLNEDNENYSDPYFNLAITNQLNRWFRHTLTLGHEAGLSATSNFTVSRYGRYGFTIDTGDAWTFTAGTYLEDELDSASILAEDRRRSGVDAYYRYRLTRYLTAGVGGTYGLTDSDIADRNYNEWTIVGDINYSLTQQMGIALVYRYLNRDADDSELSYDQNRIALTVNYSF